MKNLEKFFDTLGEILAVALVILYALAITNSTFHYLDNVPVFFNILEIARNYGALALVGIVGLEAISKRNIIFRIVYYVLIAVIVVFLFFPGTYEQLIGLVPVA